MERGRRRLPLNELAVFEAAADAGSFSGAARALGMTQSAISHHIAKLERELDLRLFERVWRGVRLTQAGLRLFEAVEKGFDQVATGLDAVRAAASRRRLTVVTDFAFASSWLVPRLDDLRRAVDDIDLRIVTGQRAGGDVDPATGDAVILFGTRPRRVRSAVRLVGEEVIAVASPRLAESLGDAAALASATLLHLEGGEGDHWTGWDDYLAHLGQRRGAVGRDLAFNNYPLLLDAAIAGHGVALGWRPLVGEAIAHGLLRDLGLAPLATHRGYYFAVPQGRSETAALRDFRGWLLAAFGLAPDGTEPAGR